MNPSTSLLKVFRNTFLFLVTSFIVSCKCEDMTCQGLTPQLAEWIPNRFGDSIKYTNGMGNEILFRVNDYKITVTKNVDCHYSSFGCICVNCEQPASSFSAISDTSRILRDTLGNPLRTYDYMSNSVQENAYSAGKYGFSYTVFDHYNTIGIDSNFNIQLAFPSDTLLPNFTIGTRTYNNVVVHETDTTANQNYPQSNFRFFVTKSYYNKEYGVIAFYDLLTQSLFYRE